MLEYPIYYPIIAGLVISIIGTLPPGIITLSILDKTLSKSLTYGLLLGFGAVAIELIQISLSFILVGQVDFNPRLTDIFLLLSACIFIIIGVFYVKKGIKTTRTSKASKKVDNFSNPILLGAALSTLNLLAIPYWMFYVGFLRSNNWLGQSLWYLPWILLGAAIGTGLIFSGYAFLARLIKEKIISWMGVSNYFIGSIFFLLAIYQLYKLLN